MHATGLDAGALARHLSLLRVAHLVRSGGVRLADTVEPYHDRVRAAVEERLTDGVRRHWHERLVAAMEACDRKTPERMAFHLATLGEDERAAGFMAEAANRAAEALAFDRAARHYRDAIACWPTQDEELRQLRIALGDVLASMGHSREAAEAYTEAVPGAKRSEALELQCEVANQLLRGGYTDLGLDTLAAVADDLGLHLPKTSFGALISLLARRIQIRLRGIGFKERDESQLSREALVRADICQHMAGSLSFADHIRGADFSTRFTIAALRLGEPSRVCNALATEAAYIFAGGGVDSAYARKLMAAAEKILRTQEEPVEGVLLGIARMVRAFTRSSWREAVKFAEEVEEESLEHRGLSHERAMARYMAICSLANMGELAELERRVPELTRDAVRRGDRYAEAGLVFGSINLIYLNRHGPDDARRRIDAMVERCDLEQNHLQAYDSLCAHCHIDLYLGQGRRALERVNAAWPALRRSFLFTAPSIGGEASHLRGRTLLAAAVESGHGPVRDKLVKLARREARWLSRQSIGWSTSLGLLISAGAEALSGDRQAAVALLGQAITEHDAGEARLYAAAARLKLGALLGEDGADLITAGKAFMEEQSVTDPDRLCAVLLPGFDAAPPLLSSPET